MNRFVKAGSLMGTEPGHEARSGLRLRWSARAGGIATAAVLLAACGEPPRWVTPSDFWMRPMGGDFVQVSSYDTTGGNRDRLELAAGDTAVLLDEAGAGVIRRIWITVFSVDPHYLRRVTLKMYWDDETEPSVAVPLGDFFGNGFDKHHYTALPMGVSSGGFYSYLPMPFRERARIVVENGTGRPLDAFYYQIGLEKVRSLPRKVQTFHALWHRDPRTESAAPHRVLTAHGSGTFVGLSFNAESYVNTLGFLEGDETYVIDGERRGFGTGTEDYFNSGWYFQDGAYAAPFHGVVLKDDARGRIAAFRWHIPDPVPFHDSIRIDLEHGHANTEVADYATVAYWYQTEPHARIPALPPPDARLTLGVKIPPGAAVRPEFRVANGSLVGQIAAPRPDRYRVTLYPSGSPLAEQVTIAVAGQPSSTVSLHADEPAVLEPVVLGDVAVEGEVTVVLRGSTRADAVAAVHLVPVRRWAARWEIVAPFANPRTPGTEHSAAIDSVYGPETDPTAAAYAGLEGREVTWQVVRAGADGRVQLNPHFTPNDWVAAYARAVLYSPTARAATLLLGADDAHVLWVNGERVSERQGRNISEPDNLAIPVRLQAGVNRILLKVADLDGGWAFMVRAADPAGDLEWR